ncbi:MAG: site-2 protease family protein [Firmicutes bacterium]|nr:site-2 protease family protein [Bacillota bacterium]
MLLRFFFSSPILAIILIIALLMALVLHEFAHAFIALKCGDRTAKINGRVTLNPLKHLDPVGTVMMLTVGFGFAKPVPVNPKNFRNFKKGMFAVSIAGVATNIALAILSSFFAVLFYFMGAPFLIWAFFYLFMQFNFMLAFFNLIPIFPLDGFRLLETFLKERNKFVQFMRKYGQLFFIFLIIMSLLSNFALMNDLPSWFRFLSPLDLYMDFTARLLGSSLIRLWDASFGVRLPYWLIYV